MNDYDSLLKRTAAGAVGFALFSVALALINLGTGFLGGWWVTVLLFVTAGSSLFQARRIRRREGRPPLAHIPEDLAAARVRSRSRVVTIWLSLIAGVNAVGWGTYSYFTSNDLVTALLLVLLISVASAAGILGAKLLGEALGRAAIGTRSRPPA